MKRIGLGYTALLCAVWVFGSAAPATAQGLALSARSFLPEFMGVAISPDGERVAAIRPHHNRNAVVIYAYDNPPGEGGDATLVVPSGEGVDIVGFAWVGDRQLFIAAGFAHQNVDSYRQLDLTEFGTHWMSLDISTGRLIHFTGLRYASVVDMLPRDPEHIMIQEVSNGFLRPALLNLNDGSRDHLSRGRREWGSFALDNRDRPRALLSFDTRVARVMYRRAGMHDWHEVHRFELLTGESANAIGILEHDDVEYVYLTSNHGGRNAIYRYRLEDGEGFEPVYANDRYDVIGLSYNPLSGARRYATYLDDVYQRHYFQQRARQLDEALNEYLPGDYAYVVDSDADQKRHIVWAFSPGRPSNFYLYDSDFGELTFFAPQFLGLEEDALANVRRFDYTASDGLEIPAYLVVPPGMENGPQPLLVWPHGGPFARDDMMFEPTRQYLASQGVLVFSPNFRGSTGYGNRFRNLGYGEWGGKMQTDVIEGVRALIAQGIADPDRICIGGWSYGAYVALYAAVETPELFRCAIGVNGVYDVQAYSDEFGERDWFGHPDAIREARWGDAAFDADAMRHLSPTHRAGEIGMPTLIIASEEDPVVDFSQAEDLIAAMRAAGRSPEVVLYEEGDHSMGYGQSRVETYEAMGDFVRRQLVH